MDMSIFETNKNVVISRDDLLSLRKLSPFVPTFPVFGERLYILGRPVILEKNWAIIFSACEYCGGKEIKNGLWGSTVCASCGAPING